MSLLKILNELIHIKHSGYIVQVKLQRRRFTGRLNGYCSVFFSPSDEMMKNKVLTVKVRGMAQIHVQHITVRLMTLGLLPFFMCYQDQSCPKCCFQFSRYLCVTSLNSASYKCETIQIHCSCTVLCSLTCKRYVSWFQTEISMPTCWTVHKYCISQMETFSHINLNRLIIIWFIC